ncbi:magnesium transporter [Nocardia aurea]|uniref:Magnesium transporter n=1 Tax=Nocardia aurea TaxID=2144174 RepID=A0ABV3FWX7_9NOCA
MSSAVSPVEIPTSATAAAHACRDVPTAEPGDTVAAVLARIRGHRFASVAVVVICEEQRLVGLLTIENLLAARDDDTMAQVMDPDPPTVVGDQDQERAVWEALRHNEPGLAVIDAGHHWIGVIPPERLLSVLLEEHDEDVARLSGYLASTAGARSASTESVALRLWHRLPWLLVGLIGSMLAAGVVDAFHSQLERQVLLAFFIPAIVYLADAVGTQTEALVIRGLSVGVGIKRILWREAVTGLLIGAIVAAVAYPITLLFWHDAAVSVSVSLSLLAACSVAAAVAMVLPWSFSKAGIDPAFGSGPLATVLQDLISIFVYLTVSAVVVG